MGSAGLKVGEPSMEDILASIRRIIADDQEVSHQPEPEETVSSPLKNVLDLAEMHVSPLLGSRPNEPVAGPWNRGEASADDAHPAADACSDLQVRHAFELEPVPAAIRAPAPQDGISEAGTSAAETLLSGAAAASITGAFDRLSDTVRPAQPQTVEDLMKELLRPMLKAWLDDNLPPLVERLVRDEIERVTRHRG
jgi:uncharacterized protein